MSTARTGSALVMLLPLLAGGQHRIELKVVEQIGTAQHCSALRSVEKRSPSGVTQGSIRLEKRAVAFRSTRASHGLFPADSERG